VYWGLKGNQGTMVTYASIGFSIIKLNWYVMCDEWVIDSCNHFSWNETSVLWVEKKNQVP